MTVDLLAELLQSRGASDFTVEVGGEVRCGGKRSDGNPWRIAIDRPIESEDGLDQRELQAIVGITDAAICTSGNYRKFYEEDGVKRSHTISPFNGYPVQHGLLSATVHAVNASTADALATACMVWGPEEGQRFIETYREANPFERVEAYFISDRGTGEWVTWESAGWDDLVIR
jgi:thiamine biosynthesis lipoprotein